MTILCVVSWFPVKLVFMQGFGGGRGNHDYRSRKIVFALLVLSEVVKKALPFLLL